MQTTAASLSNLDLAVGLQKSTLYLDGKHSRCGEIFIWYLQHIDGNSSFLDEEGEHIDVAIHGSFVGQSGIVLIKHHRVKLLVSKHVVLEMYVHRVCVCVCVCVCVVCECGPEPSSTLQLFRTRIITRILLTTHQLNDISFSSCFMC